MAVKIELKRSAVPGKIPTTGSLALGEAAINTYDGKFFFKKNVSGVESIVELANISGSIATASYAESAISSSYALTASYFSGSISNAISSSIAETSSFALTASYTPNALISASASLNVITFTKGDSTTFSITVNTGSGGGSGAGFPFSGSAVITGSLVVTGSITATQGVTASLLGTSSYAINALSASFAVSASLARNAQTASFVLNAISASFSATASFAPAYVPSSVTSSMLAPYVLSSQTSSMTVATASTALSAVSASFASTASATPNAIVTASVASNIITFTKGDGSTFPITVNTGSGGSGTGTGFPFTGSAIISGSLQVTGSIVATEGVTGSLFGTSSWATSASISNIQYVTNSIETLSQIEVLDYSADVVVSYVDGRLKFIFGTPATQSITSFSFNATFATDRFNRVLDEYTASAVWTNGGYTLISASIFEGPVLLAQTGTGTTLSYPTITSGSRTYTLFITSSNPANGTILVKSGSLTGTLSKSNPGNPTITPTAVVQLSAASNQIEQGATGSISFITASGAANGWVLNFVTSSRTSPIAVVGALTGSTSIGMGVTASYSSSGVAGSDNSPALVTAVVSSTTFTKIRSLRSGATVSASLNQGEIENLSAWDTSLGGSVGTILKGTTTVSGQSVTINWTGDKYHYIVYNGSLSFLTNITAAGFGVLSSFTSSSVGEYKVYRTTLLQAGGAGTSITYVLT